MTDADLQSEWGNTERFLTQSADQREEAIRDVEEQVWLKQRELACMVLAHAAQLLVEEFDGGAHIEFSVSAGYEDGDTVRLTGMQSAAGNDVELRPDFEPDPPALLEAERLLAYASDLGVGFASSSNRGLYRMTLTQPLVGCSFSS